MRLSPAWMPPRPVVWLALLAASARYAAQAAAPTPRLTPAQLAAAVADAIVREPDMTINWEGGFQYGGAVTADGLEDAAAQFAASPGAKKWLAVLDRYLDRYLRPPSAEGMVACGTHFDYGAANASAQSCAFELLHNTTLQNADTLEATVGDHLGTAPHPTPPSHPKFSPAAT